MGQIDSVKNNAYDQWQQDQDRGVGMYGSDRGDANTDADRAQRQAAAELEHEDRQAAINATVDIAKPDPNDPDSQPEYGEYGQGYVSGSGSSFNPYRYDSVADIPPGSSRIDGGWSNGITFIGPDGKTYEVKFSDMSDEERKKYGG